MIKSLVASNDRLWRLTPRQKDCLRLVAQGHQSKSIARELGISPLRVDKHIAGARKILGISDRLDAARLLQKWEQQGGGTTDASQWGAPSSGLPNAADPISNRMEDDSVEGPMAANIRGQARSGEAHFDNYERARILLPSAPRVGRRTDNDLGVPRTFVLLVAIAAFVVAAGAIVSLLLSLSQPPR